MTHYTISFCDAEPQPQPNVGVPPNFQPAGFERVPSTSSQEDVMREIDRRNTSNFMQQGQPVETQYRGMNIREQRMEQQKDDDFPTFDPDDYPLPLMESRRKERDSDMEEREKRERDPDRRERESERRDRDSDRRDRESDRRERGSERRERASRYDRDDRDKDDDGDRKLKDRRDEDDRDRRRRDESRREESRSDDRSREKKAKMSLDERRHRGFPDDVRPGRLTRKCS